VGEDDLRATGAQARGPDRFGTGAGAQAGRSETVSGVVHRGRRVRGPPVNAGVLWRGLRTVAIDATSLHVPDRPAITAGYRKRSTDKLTFGYPLLRLSVLVECGTRAILAATFGPQADGETNHARRLLHAIGDRMLVLADAGYDSWDICRSNRRSWTGGSCAPSTRPTSTKRSTRC
jgi:hypothetical protein